MTRLVMLFVLALSLGVASTGFGDVDYAEITFLLGDAQVRVADTTGWVQVELGMKLNEGDSIRTAEESRLELILAQGGGVIRVDEGSLLVLSEVSRKGEDRSTKSNLLAGSVWANVRKLTTKRSSFSIESPTAVAAIRGTIYRMMATPDYRARVFVYEGQVSVGWRPPPQLTQSLNGVPFQEPTEVAGPSEIPPPQEISMEEWTRLVAAGQQVRLTPQGISEVMEFDREKDTEDEWVRWNKERDQRLAR